MSPTVSIYSAMASMECCPLPPIMTAVSDAAMADADIVEAFSYTMANAVAGTLTAAACAVASVAGAVSTVVSDAMLNDVSGKVMAVAGTN